MNFFENIIYSLQKEMETPESFGWFHLLWISLTIISILILYLLRKKYNEKQLKIVLGTYGIIALILEVTKQIIWSFNYDAITNTITWDYQWYAAPFQLCTTPIYVSLICLFLKNNKLRKVIFSYLCYITILGGFFTIILPESCFVKTIEINIHTMWLHCGSFVLSIYLLINEIKPTKQNFKNSFLVFLVFIVIAEILNLFIYNIGVLNGETFNMFYISPYFESILPVFNTIQTKVPFIIFLLIYIFAIFMGSLLVYFITKLFKKKIK